MTPTDDFEGGYKAGIAISMSILERRRSDNPDAVYYFARLVEEQLRQRQQSPPTYQEWIEDA